MSGLPSEPQRHPSKVGKADVCRFTSLNASTETIRWLVAGAAQKGATARTFVPTVGNLHKLLACSVTLTGSGGSLTTTSASAKVSLGSPLVVVRAPALSGRHAVGDVESARTGTWSPRATSYSYKWYARSSAVHGAKSSRYVPTGSDKDKTIHCVVAAHRAGHASGIRSTGSVVIT
jgi:hypothetical protein